MNNDITSPPAVSELMTCNPYLYIIGWTSLDRYYIGIRYANGCDPSDLWVSYFTSSKLVAKYREEHGEPDYREVLLTGTKDFIAQTEHQTILENELHKSPRWLNQAASHNHIYRKTEMSEETRAKIRAARASQIFTDETRAKLSAASKGKPKSAEHAANIGRASKGRTHSAEARNKNRQARLGRSIHTEESKRRIGEHSKARIRTDEWRAKQSAAAKLREQRKREARDRG